MSLLDMMVGLVVAVQVAIPISLGLIFRAVLVFLEKAPMVEQEMESVNQVLTMVEVVAANQPQAKLQVPQEALERVEGMGLPRA
jgi:hypothetical protein